MSLEQRSLAGRRFVIYCFRKIKLLPRWKEFDNFEICESCERFIHTYSERDKR